MGSSLNEQPPGKPGGCSIVAFFNAGWFFIEKALLALGLLGVVYCTASQSECQTT